MERIINNIFQERDLNKCSKNVKSRKYFFGNLQNDAMDKPHTKKGNDNFSSITDNAKLRKELKLMSHQDSEDITYLKIQNDNDFVLKAKETTHKIPSKKQNLKRNASITKDKIKNSEENDTIISEKIVIECNQKNSFEDNNDDEFKYNEELVVEDQTELNAKPRNDIIYTTDLKSDLQSLLIMMAISNNCNESEDLNREIQNFQGANGNEKKQMINKIEPLKESNTFDKMSNLLKIDGLKIITDDEKILRKYADKWMEYIKKQREKKIHSKRLATINKFLEKLEKKKVTLNLSSAATNKAKLQARDYNTYQHRYRVQKHIIALQKNKLEQQNKLIEELKYNKIVEASRQSLDHMKDDIKQTYYEIDKHLKPKIKCLTNELKIQGIEENSLVLHCLKVPHFLQRMEARAREREEKHAIIRERRKQMEEERIRLKQQAEIAKAEMDKEEKLKIIKELREKRKREKIENIRKKQYAERLRALIVMADLHYEKSLMAKYGIRPLKLLMEMKQDSLEKAKVHYQFQLKKNIFLHWMWHTEDMWYERNYKAQDFNRKKLLRRAFNGFKTKYKEYLIKLQVAKDYYEFYITHFVFKKFQEGVLIIKKEYNNKWTNAIIYYNSNLLFKALTSWRTLPALNALKREQDARKLRWRQKVLQVVPDYVPPDE